MSTKETTKLTLWHPTETMYDAVGNDFKKTKEGSNESFVAADDMYAVAKAVSGLTMYGHGSCGMIQEACYDPEFTGTQFVRIEDVITLIYGLTHTVESGQTIVINEGGKISPRKEGE